MKILSKNATSIKAAGKVSAGMLAGLLVIGAATTEAMGAEMSDKTAAPSAAALSAADICRAAEVPTARLFLQQITATSAIIKWRGEASQVCVGTDASQLTIAVPAVDEGHHKYAYITGLAPDTTYFYSVGGAAAAPDGQFFHTAPETGAVPSDGNTHIWILGDSGSATETDTHGKLEYPGDAIAVKDGYAKYRAANGVTEPLDLLLLLGDNAYSSGMDSEWQGGFFDVYPDLIKAAQTLPTIGNHEMGVGLIDICLFRPIPACDKGPVPYPVGGASRSSDPDSYDSDGDGPDADGLPYLNIFSLPSRGEMGGIASGTEQYYAADYGHVHIVSLDSQLANGDETSRMAMRDWLINDLEANSLDWTIVIFHHPPYSKGENHDSDREQREIDMRQTFAPVFEDYGVDVVYSGHSHSYERSWYLHGHYGDAASFDAKIHTEYDDNGNPAFGFADQPYPQVSAISGKDDKLVYTVAGSAGKANHLKPCKDDKQMYGCTRPDWLQHPAHRSFTPDGKDFQPHGIARLGSVVLDVGKNRLVSKFIDVDGTVLDQFVITR